MAPSTRAEAGKTLRARSRSGFIASANMANVLALFGNMFAFKGSFQAEVRAASTSRFPARVATVVVSSRDDVVRDAPTGRAIRDAPFRDARRLPRPSTRLNRTQPALTLPPASSYPQITVGENENGESAIRRFRRAVMSSGHINEVRTRRLDDPSLSRDTRPIAEGRARDVFPRVSFARASSRAPSRPASGSRPRRKCLTLHLKREACLRSIVFVFPRPELTPPLPRPLLSADPPP